MNIMGCRLIHLQKTLEGLIKTGIHLVEYDNHHLVPPMNFDDLGIYIIIPHLAWFFNLSIEQSINLFFYGIALLSFFISFFGWSKVYSSLSNRLVAWMATGLLTYLALRIGDVYLAYFVCVNSLMPWTIYFAQKKEYSQTFLCFLFFAGFIISFFHYIRAFSGFGMLIFMVILLVTSLPLTKKQWLKAILALSIGGSIPIISFNTIYNQSIAYTKDTLQKKPEKNHVFWHSVYIGFGFLKEMNPGIVYNDTCGEQKVKTVDPTITIEQTNQYESILKHEVFNIIKNKWQFFIFTLFAKLGILLFYLLLFANVGILCRFLFPKPWNIEIAFFATMAFYSLFALLTMPYREYSLGFISCATIYGVVSINYALQQLFKNHTGIKLRSNHEART